MSAAPDRYLVLKVAALGLAMFGFGFALVPLYDVFCDITGFGGKTAAAAVVIAETPDVSRTVRVEFLASVPRGVPFTLEPEVSHLDVHPGQMYETHFRAQNLTGSPLTAQAVPSVAPGAAARYFNKAECFCFTSQSFQPHETLDLKLAFMVATELPAHVDTLSLSYTYFTASN
ncbi:MAG TPA: cytochrome c oxidase assembly protein [Gammaproteobacteria bacterium]|nr:cytochrome c oxidase assembly protein [Gammaproteobacteria bacterium]